MISFRKISNDIFSKKIFKVILDLDNTVVPVAITIASSAPTGKHGVSKTRFAGYEYFTKKPISGIQNSNVEVGLLNEDIRYCKKIVQITNIDSKNIEFMDLESQKIYVKNNALSEELKLELFTDVTCEFWNEELFLLSKSA